MPAPDFQEGEDFMRGTLFAHQNYGEMGRGESEGLLPACSWVCLRVFGEMKARGTSRSPSWRMSAGRSSDIPDGIEVGLLGEKGRE